MHEPNTKVSLFCFPRYYLREMKLNGTSSRLHIEGLHTAVALDFHWAEQSLYWSDVDTDGSQIQMYALGILIF